MTIRHLGTRDLAERWSISRRTLDRWRWAGEGPRFLKLGGRVVYRIADIEAFEQQQLRTRTDLPANLTMALFSKAMHFSSQAPPMAAFRHVRGVGSRWIPARWNHLR